MFGFKIFDNDSQENLKNILQFANEENLTIEIALYNKKEDMLSFKNFLLNNKDFDSLKNKSIHLDYKKYIGGELTCNNIDVFRKELSIAKDLGIKQAVLHYQEPSSFRNHLLQLEEQNLEKNLHLIYQIINEFNIYVFIENTLIHQRKSHYNNLSFHRRIWDTVLKLNLQDKIGICLDWGHVKAFSHDNLEDWITYCLNLREQGMSIYMHIHDNDSIKDLHETLHNGKRRGFDKIEGNQPFIDLLSKYYQKFSKESLILEYRSDFAVEAYLEIKKDLQI